MVARHPVQGGYTPAERTRVVLADGRRAFVKRSVSDDTRRWLLRERDVYTALRGAPFLARMLAFDDGDPATLVLEDLGTEGWPPPWTEARVAQVLRSLDALADTPPPACLRPQDLAELTGWSRVAADPAPFLGLGLRDGAWLDRSLPRLVAAEALAPPGPLVPAHVDTRSDNLCFTARGCVLVDWNWAALAPRGLDRSFWAASLHAEGGPLPETVAEDHPTWPARVSGYFAARAGLPQIPHAPRVRWIQRVQLESALPWAERALGLV